MTWGIWRILTRALESLKKFHFKALLLSKVCFFGAKYRGVIFHDTEEGYKIWRGIDFSFQNWHKEFDKFWPDYSKVSEINFNGLFLSKICIVWAKKVQRSCLSWHAKFEEKLTCDLENDMRNLANFHQSTPKCQNWDFDGMIFLSKLENVWA